MIRRFLSLLRNDRSGMATVEFALLSVMFFGVMMAALDLGMWYQQRLRLDSAVEQGTMIAFNQRGTLDSAAAAAIGTFVGSAAKLSTNPTVVVGCNGGTNNCSASNRLSYCVSGSPPNVVYTQTASSVCGDNSLPGYYMTISVTATSNTVIVPAAMLGGAMVQTRRAVIRLQ